MCSYIKVLYVIHPENPYVNMANIIMWNVFRTDLLSQNN